MERSLGKMFAYQLFDWRNSVTGTIQQTVAAFLKIGEAIATRWIQTPKGVLLLQMVPENPESGAVYVFDRQREHAAEQYRQRTTRSRARCSSRDVRY